MEELIKKAQAGDEEAFTQIIISMESELYKVARTRLECEDDINEAVQETIIQTFKSIQKVKEPRFFKTWLIKILINNCNKVYNKRNKYRALEYDENVIYDESYNSIEESNDKMDFFFMIKKLNYNERITLTLYYVEKFTTKEISKILKEPESTIKNRILRAKNKLRREFQGGIYNG